VCGALQRAPVTIEAIDRDIGDHGHDHRGILLARNALFLWPVRKDRSGCVRLVMLSPFSVAPGQRPHHCGQAHAMPTVPGLNTGDTI